MSYQFGDFELDVPGRELLRENRPVSIEPKAFDVLCLLIENRERVVSKDELIEMVWGGRFISDSAVSTAVKAVRQALGDDGRKQTLIRTIHGRGFRFIAELGSSAAPVEEPRAAMPDTPPEPQTNLRRRRRALIGRAGEINEIALGLRPGGVLSIIGPGGAGKSALASAAAAELLEHFPGGVWFCELAPVQASQVPSAVLGAIDSSAGAGPVNAAMIVERFQDRRTLLVLDNCEHVIEAAADLAEALIELAPNLALLITSREALELSDEKILWLNGLSYREIDGVAVELFHRCAEQIADLPKTTENNTIIRKITERLEGLPLAIELAAPRLASNSLPELLHALDDQLTVLATRRRRGEARHSAMDDAIAWSYALLDADEKATLSSLSIFSGAFTAQAAEAICETTQPRTLLHNLVGQSMVAFLPGAPTSRFRLLEPIRQFARRQLDDAHLAVLEERHANWFAKRGAELAAQMRGPKEIAACEALTVEWSDFGRALAWGRRQGQAEIAVAPLLAMGMHLLWQLRIEAFGWLEEGVAACELPQEERARADLIRSIGAWSMGDLDRSEALMTASIAAGGETVETAYFQFYQGFAREDFDKVFRCGERAWRLAQGSEDLPWKIATTAFHVCGCAMHKGDAPEIPGLYAELDRLLSAYEWPSGRCCALIGRTVAAFGRGDPNDVERYRTELGKAADRCHAPWFKVTAAGIEARKTRTVDEAWAELRMYTKNLESAILSGDMIQLPTILRAVAICLVDGEQYETAAKLAGLIPSIRGLGEKGSLAPGYEDALALAQNRLSGDMFQHCIALGQSWQIMDVVEALKSLLPDDLPA